MESRPSMRYGDVSPELNSLAAIVMDCALEVHRILGSGLREEDYVDCLLLEMGRKGLRFEREVRLSLLYKGTVLVRSARMDILVEGILPLEVKAVEDLHPRHFLQARSYVKFGGFGLGILVNFHQARLVEGWHRILPGRPQSAVARVADVASSHAEPGT